MVGQCHASFGAAKSLRTSPPSPSAVSSGVLWARSCTVSYVKPLSRGPGEKALIVLAKVCSVMLASYTSDWITDGHDAGVPYLSRQGVERALQSISAEPV